MTKTTDIYFDFEFIDDGHDIVPISLGMCTSSEPRLPLNPGEFYIAGTNPHELYIEYAFDPARASDWVRENVFPYLKVNGGGYNTHLLVGDGRERHRAAVQIEAWVREVCGDSKPKFWGYYPSYDWVLLCQHWGTMLQGPKGWPIRPECLMQMADQIGADKDSFPAQPKDSHNAIADAKWNRDLHEMLKARGNEI